MAEGLSVDTSSYPKPSAPQNPLDVATKLGGMQSQALQIDQQKLGLLNDRMHIVAKDLTSLLPKPDLNRNDLISHADNLTKLGYITPEIRQKLIAEIPNTDNPDVLRKHVEATISRGQELQNAINWHAGQPGAMNTGQQIIPTLTTNRPSAVNAGRGVVQGGATAPVEVPPTAETIGTVVNPQTGEVEKQRQLFGTQPGRNPLPVGGPTAPQQAAPVRAPLPAPNVTVTRPGQPSIAPKDQGRLPVQVPTVPGAKPVRTEIYRTPQPVGPASGLPPGQAEAETQAGSGSGEHLARERVRSASFQREVFPLEQAIPLMEKLGTKGTGPGTETINNLKSFVLSNVPGVKESDFNGTVADYDKAHKYLTDFVNMNSAGGTNDRLAAAFAGNPSMKISNAAAVDVAKAALSLRRMQQAQYLEFEKQGLPASQFSKWVAKRTNDLDARAFGADFLDKDKRDKLIAQLKKNPAEYARFERSLEMAHTMGFITPPSGRQ